ncbi:MAG: 50S ribosomal protein L25/general stress protein Ctc, partial [Rhodospirillaceae bacterium]|nr:50S ribosomal protein L25/general stress protein Ctc [Rhodospirillaceae bacterium]
MADIIEMKADARERAGKGTARALRRMGFVPAVVYGANKDPILISIDGKTLNREINKKGFFTHQYDIAVDGANQHVLPRDVQFDPVTDAPIHVDFLRVTEATKIKVSIGVEFINEEESPGLKRGGVINIVRHEIEVLCSV